MKHKSFFYVVVGLLTLGLVPHAGAEQRAETSSEVVTYLGPSLTPSAYKHCGPSAVLDCVRFETAKADRFVTLDISDGTGLSLRGSWEQPGTQNEGHFCGSTSRPLRIQGGFPVDVYIYGDGGHWACEDGTAVATAGTVTATFSTTKGNNS